MKRAIILLIFCFANASCINDLPITEGQDCSLRSPNSSAEQLFAYIKTKYAHTINGRECIFYPAANPKRLVISFGYAIAGRYAMWTWFWRKDEKWIDTAYLFLKDDDLCWYLGNNAKPAFDDYCDMIKSFVRLCGVQKDRVYTAGGSMGGYGAILFATVLGFKGAVVDIPTVTRDIWQTYQPPNTTKIRSQDRWVDLDAVMACYKRVPLISIHHGRNKADVLAAHALMDVIIDRAPLIIYRTTSKPAHSVFTITKASLEADIAYMEEYQSTRGMCATSIEWPYQLLERNNALFTFGYSNTVYKALLESVNRESKGAVLVHPCKHGQEYAQLQITLAEVDTLPFVSITYNKYSRDCAYDLLKLMRDKIGCFTLHYMPKNWQMNHDHLENVLAHLKHQKLLQMPHFI